MLESLFLGACSIGGAFLHGAIMEDALNNNGKKIADAITNTKVNNQSTTDINTNTNTKVETVNFTDCVYNSIDCFCNIIYDKEIKSYNIDKLVNSYNLLYFIIPKEHKFFPNTYEKLALLKFLCLHNAIALDPNLDINSPNAITDEIDDITQYSIVDYSSIDGTYGLLCCGVGQERHNKVTKAINLKFQDKLKLWYELKEKDRRNRDIGKRYSKFYANYTPLSTRDLFNKIISVLTKHYNYNIKEIQFEPVYSCLLNKVI